MEQVSDEKKSKEDKAVLYLIPNRIAETSVDNFFTDAWRSQLRPIRHFLAEHVRSARQFLSALKTHERIEDLEFGVLDVNTPATELEALMKPLLEGYPMGVLSESGCPGVADPGAMAVAFAHDHGIAVRPLVGPSSILLALMGSGMSGQRFTFNGYLPVDQKELVAEIRKLERISREQNATQIFIESPHRNGRLLDNLIAQLSPGTRLCVALDLTGPGEKLTSKAVQEWRKSRPEPLPKLPCIFLFQA